MTSTSKLIVHSQNEPLRGTITVPGDKSISHRAVLLAALAEGVSVIRNWLPAGDTLATLEVVRALGVNVEVDERGPQAWDLRVEGRGLRGLRRPGPAHPGRRAHPPEGGDCCLIIMAIRIERLPGLGPFSSRSNCLARAGPALAVTGTQRAGPGGCESRGQPCRK